MIELEELVPSGQKSFGGKAIIVKDPDRGAILFSYKTPVAQYDGYRFIRLWDGYSATTMRHINDFRKLYGLDSITKSQWCAMTVEA